MCVAGSVINFIGLSLKTNHHAAKDHDWSQTIPQGQWGSSDVSLSDVHSTNIESLYHNCSEGLLKVCVLRLSKLPSILSKCFLIAFDDAEEVILASYELDDPKDTWNQTFLYFENKELQSNKLRKD